MDHETETGSPKSAEPAVVTIAEFGAALHRLVGCLAFGPTLQTAIGQANDEPRQRLARAFSHIYSSYGVKRSIFAQIDSDIDLTRASFSHLARRPSLQAEFAAITLLWSLTGIASRLIHTERLRPLRDQPVAQMSPLTDAEREINKRQVVLEAFAGRTRLSGRPWLHLIDISSVCNLRCKTCYQSSSQDFIYFDLESAPLTPLVEVMPYGEWVNIGGTGEPLLSPTTVPIVQEYSKLGAHVEVTTNGTLAARLRAVAQTATMINISMDGASKAVFDVIRFGASFEKITRNILELPEDIRRKININCVVFRPNAHEGGDLIRQARKMGVGGVSFQEFGAYLPSHQEVRLRPQDRRIFFDSLENAGAFSDPNLRIHVNVVRAVDGEAEHDDGPTPEEALAALGALPSPVASRMSWAQLADAVDDVLPRVAEILDAILGPLSSSSTISPDIAELAEEIDPIDQIRSGIANGSARAPHCFAPFTTMYLRSDGNLQPCCVVPTQVGSLERGAFEGAWNDAAFVQFRAGIQGQAAQHPRCKGCRDGIRFSGLVDALRILDAEGLDVRRIARPIDFEVVDAFADHPLVKLWGSEAGRYPTTKATTKPIALPENAEHRLRYSATPLIDLFRGATFSSEELVDTPSGKGIFLSDKWETSEGPRSTLIVVSGFSVAFPKLRIHRDTSLQFDCGAAFPSASKVRLWLDARRPDAAALRLWQDDLTPPSGKAELRPVKVDLSPCSGMDVQLCIGVETPSGDSSGHWGVFAEPTLVSAKLQSEIMQ